MKKLFLVLVSVLLAIVTVGLPVRAQDGCGNSSTQNSGVLVINTTGCKEVILKIEGTQVYPVVTLTTTPAPTITVTPSVAVGTSLAEPALNSVDVVDNGSETAFSDKASLLISNPAEKYLNVHIHPDFRDGYVFNDVMGRAANGRFYAILCSGTENWYKVSYNGFGGWIHQQGKLIYATVVNSSNIPIPVCSAEG